MKKLRVGVIYGGRSGEHEISVASAASIFKHIDRTRYEPIPIRIEKDGRWTLSDRAPAALSAAEVIQHARVNAARHLRAGRDTLLAAYPNEETLITVERRPSDSEQEVDHAVVTGLSLDVVFPVLHGPYGEDGTIQGLLELAGVPYVGAGVLASAAGMDKEFTKKLLAAEGLPIGDQVVLRSGDRTVQLEDRERLGLPVFVKPARGGSSIGVSRVTAWDQLPSAIELARRHDPKVIVEAAIPGRELECGVLELPDGSVEASTVGEIRVAGVRGREDAFYDFETKYLDDAAELDVPAKVDDDIADEIRQLAIRAFRAIDCQGLARVDFFLTDDGPVINEINTMPGFTTISMYPRMWAASGVDYPTLLATMVDTAMVRGTGLR